jgi:hypothetical protein
MAKRNLQDYMPMPVGEGVVVTVSRVNGKTGKVEDVAEGTYSIESSSWSFSGSETGTNTWLEEIFNNPPKNGRIVYLKDDEAFLMYLLTNVLPRKGLSMDWKKAS